MNRILIAAGVLLIAALGFAGNSDYNQAAAQQAEYCQNVADGVWPDYRGEYGRLCAGE